MKEMINGKPIPNKSCRYCHYVVEPASPYNNSTLSEAMRLKIITGIDHESIPGLKCHHLKWGNKILYNFAIKRSGKNKCRFFTKVNHALTLQEMGKDIEQRQHRTGRILTIVGIVISLIVLFISGWTFITKTLPQSTQTQQQPAKP